MRSPVLEQGIRAYYNIPEQVVYCRRCVISNQRPRIVFDERGVCNACNHADRKKYVIDWKERECRLVELLDRHRSRAGRYDVVVPCSGGKDSAFVAHQLKYRYGMHPLTVTWAPHLYTEVGWGNLQRFIQSGFDNILGTPNGKVHRALTRLSFELLGDPFQPFIYGQMSFPFRIAVNYRIPLVFYGENGEAEYGGSTDNEDKPGQALEDFSRFYFSGLPPDDLAKEGVSDADLEPYRLPAYEELKAAGIEMHWFGYYRKWVPQENYYYAAEHTGFHANPDGRSEGTYSKYASLDDRIDGFHYYMGFIKFGIGRATSDAAHEIREGHISREEGVALVRRYDGEFPKKYFSDFLDYTGLAEKRFWGIVDSFRAPHLWQRADGQWRLRHQVS